MRAELMMHRLSALVMLAMSLGLVGCNATRNRRRLQRRSSRDVDHTQALSERDNRCVPALFARARGAPKVQYVAC
jgi:hypothetical protein